MSRKGAFASIAVAIVTVAALWRLASCYQQPECAALPAPPSGMTLTYFARASGTSLQEEVQPTWDAAARAFLLPTGTVAVLSCPPGKDLVVGNRTQPTGTLNRTCTYVNGETALFQPILPGGVGIACKPAANASFTRTRCALGHVVCGLSACCLANDTCSPGGLKGYGLCCPQGTSPCGDSLCCNAGEVCSHSNHTARCCSKGSKPCGKEACCNAGEQCFPTLAGGRGVCCPGGKGYTPCVGFESHVLSDGQPWHCCEAGETCTLPLMEQEAWQPTGWAPSGRCLPNGSTECGDSWCSPLEQCANVSSGLCVLRNATRCGASGEPCAPGHCLRNGTCCPASWKPCGKSACCQPEASCWPKANGGEGLCCGPGAEAMLAAAAAPQAPAHPLNKTTSQHRWRCCPKGGAACGDSCCGMGEVCNPEAVAAGGQPNIRVCCPINSIPCGRSSCCPVGYSCLPGTGGGQGTCCPAGSKSCGSTCCGPGATCLPEFGGQCCGGSTGWELCGSTCCAPYETCSNGRCIRKCDASVGQQRCGDACCSAGAGETCCGGQCCLPGGTCCGDGACCPPSMMCSNGQCVEMTCSAGEELCGGVCCGKGHACSFNRLRCCPKDDLECLLSEPALQVQCASGMGSCPLQGHSCIAVEQPAGCYCSGPGAISYRCCADGALPCSGVDLPYDTCCPPDRACVNYESYPFSCCPAGAVPCGNGRCCGEREWCAMVDFSLEGASPLLEPVCFDRTTHRPCGHIVCPRAHTCYSGARSGMGLCCPPGQRACRALDKLGRADWSYCC